MKTPNGILYNSIKEMLDQPHLLIAGSTGSGKSVLINTLIYSILYKFPKQARLVLIDPKRVELRKWEKVPHTMIYANTEETISNAINRVIEGMEARFKQMEYKGLSMYDGSDVYVIIDEYLDLKLRFNKEIEKKIIRLACLGRASKIHLILATQRPTRDVINGSIKACMDWRVALRCSDQQASRNIMGTNDAYGLPQYGYGYLQLPTKTELIEIPYTTPEELEQRAEFWKRQRVGFFEKMKYKNFI